MPADLTDLSHRLQAMGVAESIQRMTGERPVRRRPYLVRIAAFCVGYAIGISTIASVIALAASH